MYNCQDELLTQHQYIFIVDPKELGEGPLANKQVWILRMEAAKLVKEKVNEKGMRGGVNRRNSTKEYMWMENQERQKNTIKNKRKTSCWSPGI